MKLSCLMLVCLLAAPTAFAQALEGVWILSIDTPRGLQNPVLTISRTEDGYAGTYEGRMGRVPISAITRDGDNFAFPLTISIPIGDIEVQYAGTVTGEEMMGVVANPRGEVPFSGVRQQP